MLNVFYMLTDCYLRLSFGTFAFSAGNVSNVTVMNCHSIIASVILTVTLPTYPTEYSIVTKLSDRHDGRVRKIEMIL